jgi:ABC-type branched-subunit amino acid transport system substrate-binding protein
LKEMKKTFFFLTLFLMACRPSPVNVMLIMADQKSMNDFKKGLELASEKINSEGGIYGHNVKTTAAARPADECIGELERGKVSVVIMGVNDLNDVSSVVKAAKPGSVPMIFVNPLPYSEESGAYIVSFSRSADEEAFFLGDFCAFSLHASKVLILSRNGRLAASFKSGFEKEGRGSVEVAMENGCGENELQKIKEMLGSADPPQSVFWASEKGIPREVSSLLNDELKGRVLFVPFSSTLDGLSRFPENTMTAAPSSGLNSRNIPAVEFNVNYRSRFDTAPTSFSALGYEVMMNLKQSFENGAKTAAEVRKFFMNGEINFVLLGKLNFNSAGELVNPFDASMIVKDSIVPLRELDRTVLVGLQEKVLACRYGQKNGKTADKK